MLIMEKERASQVALLLKAAPLFLINKVDAIQLAIEQVETVQQRWSAMCDEANSARSIETFFGCANS
jgi:serine/threonine-protein kinase HipA